MGYETSHNLNIEGDSPTITEVARMLAGRGRNSEDGADRTTEWELTLEGRPTTWYDCTENMQDISRHWPDTLFIIRASGENPGDQWVEYHRNGQVQREERPPWDPAPCRLDVDPIYPVIIDLEVSADSPLAWIRELNEMLAPDSDVTVSVHGKARIDDIASMTNGENPKHHLGVTMTYWDQRATFRLADAEQRAPDLARAWGRKTGEQWTPKPPSLMTPKAVRDLLAACQDCMYAEWEVDDGSIDDAFVEKHRPGWSGYMTRNEE